MKTRRGWRYQRVIRSRESNKNRQHNGQKKKDKRTNNDLEYITHKTKDRVTRTSQIMLMWLLSCLIYFFFIYICLLFQCLNHTKVNTL
jgi:hypothetical protein